MFAIVEVRIRSPDALQHLHMRQRDQIEFNSLHILQFRHSRNTPYLDAQRQRLHRTAELETRVAPMLPEIAVHRIVHVQFGHRTHAADDHVGFDQRRNALAVRRQVGLFVAFQKVLEEERNVAAEQIVGQLWRTRRLVFLWLRTLRWWRLFHSAGSW